MSKSGKQRRRLARAPRVPVAVPGGIRAQNLRNLKARPWWARRLLETLEGFALGSRLGRGRAYAASGQVRELHITPGLVSAVVQGAEPNPYATEIRVRVADPGDAETLSRAVLENPVWVARLGMPDFPAEIEPLFLSRGLPLFPIRENDLAARCTCRDWGKPCKHIAALFYILAEAVERDPGLLLLLRGIKVAGASCPHEEEFPTHPLAPAPPPEPNPPGVGSRKLEVGLQSFWGEDTPPFDNFGPVPKSSPAPLFRVLGSFPFWRGVERFHETMANVHARATTLGIELRNGARYDFKPVATGEKKPLFYPSGGRFRMDATVS